MGTPGEVVYDSHHGTSDIRNFSRNRLCSWSKAIVKQPVLSPFLRERIPVVPAMVGGFQVPENVRYHAGHTWALNESRELVRVGIDDFASNSSARLKASLCRSVDAGSVKDRSLDIFRDGKSVDMVSPIEGTISDVNEAVAKIRNWPAKILTEKAGS